MKTLVRPLVPIRFHMLRTQKTKTKQKTKKTEIKNSLKLTNTQKKSVHRLADLKNNRLKNDKHERYEDISSRLKCKVANSLPKPVTMNLIY